MWQGQCSDFCSYGQVQVGIQQHYSGLVSVFMFASLAGHLFEIKEEHLCHLHPASITLVL